MKAAFCGVVGRVSIRETSRCYDTGHVFKHLIKFANSSEASLGRSSANRTIRHSTPLIFARRCVERSSKIALVTFGLGRSFYFQHSVLSISGYNSLIPPEVEIKVGVDVGCTPRHGNAGGRGLLKDPIRLNQWAKSRLKDSCCLTKNTRKFFSISFF